MNKAVDFIVRTAILLALAVLLQSLRLFLPVPALVDQYIIGSLVNLCLIVAAVTVGIEGGLVVAILTPLVAFLQNVLPNPIMVPFVALGNAVIVVVVALLYRRNRYVALAVGAICKFLVLYITVVHVAIPLFMPDLPLPAKELMTLKFSWPQLVTASVGGMLALLVLPGVERALKRR